MDISDKPKKNLILISPYFGNWPKWFDAHLKSIEFNSSIDWLIPTDCQVPSKYPNNIKFIPTDLLSLNQKINHLFNQKIPLYKNPRKFCDLKPSYGKIFEKHISKYHFWGFTDLDIIWGNIRKFITNEIFQNSDIISSRLNAISGHFTLVRNTKKLNDLYLQIQDYDKKLQNEQFQWSDEIHFTNLILEKNKKSTSIRTYWPKYLLNVENGIDSHQEYHLDRWRFENGSVINTITKNEVMYLHFINWKNKITKNEAIYANSPESFIISYNGIHIKQNNRISIICNHIKNIFFGYWTTEWQRNQIKLLKQKIGQIKVYFFKDRQSETD